VTGVDEANRDFHESAAEQDNDEPGAECGRRYSPGDDVSEPSELATRLDPAVRDEAQSSPDCNGCHRRTRACPCTLDPSGRGACKKER